jgi:uncharacterized protein (DUF2235 family)
MPLQKKRIAICADGTWNDPEDENPTNVLRMARAIRPVAPDGVKQVVFYDWGVGTYYAKTRGGTSGLGMMKNIQDGYRFIVQNYNPGDEIYLFGFSRGAYTVRSLAGMLNNCGILKRMNAAQIPEAFKFYKKRSAKPGSPEAGAWRAAHSISPHRGAVDFIGVWDTVGALGVPTRVLAFVDESDLFFDPILGSNVRVARHAVSIDEKRGDFVPTIWEPKESADLEQVWFAGVHSDVGGGYAPSHGELSSDIPLAWMAREAELNTPAGKKGLRFESHLYTQNSLNPLAPLHKSYKRFWKVLGKHVRRLPKDAVIHRSVQNRYEAGEYDSEPLNDWITANGGFWGAVAS